MNIFFDGASSGNPGPSGAGYYVEIEGPKGPEIKNHGGYKYLGDKGTNNEAEYNGLLLGLNYLKNRKDPLTTPVTIYGDSKLVIMQMKGLWKVKADNLIPLFKEAQKLTKDLKDSGIKIEFTHVLRDKNKNADKMSNMAINLESEGHEIVL